MFSICPSVQLTGAEPPPPPPVSLAPRAPASRAICTIFSSVGVDTPSVDLFASQDLPAHKAFLAHDMAILEGLAYCKAQVDAIVGRYAATRLLALHPGQFVICELVGLGIGQAPVGIAVVRLEPASFLVGSNGAVDIAGFVATLEGAGFTGWYVLEQDAVLDADPEPGAGPVADAKKSFEYLASLT